APAPVSPAASGGLKAAGAGDTGAGAGDFDFLIGHWRVRHRVLRKGSQRDWMEFEGTSSTRKVLGGQGNIEENLLASPAGAYHAMAIRSFDAKSAEWSIWWLDGRFPLGPLDPPVRRRFQDGVGAFYSDDLVDGKSRRTRYLWSKITPATCQWDQATSNDQGATWETNWVMAFNRVAPR
uniref:hypothetical protein n=1 Tax=Phenylobacterium sp. TaxID=1871053 RepID=UPI0030F3CD30